MCQASLLLLLRNVAFRRFSGSLGIVLQLLSFIGVAVSRRRLLGFTVAHGQIPCLRMRWLVFFSVSLPIDCSVGLAELEDVSFSLATADLMSFFEGRFIP